MNNKIKSWVLKSIVISLLFQSFSIQAQELKQKLSDLLQPNVHGFGGIG